MSFAATEQHRAGARFVRESPQLKHAHLPSSAGSQRPSPPDTNRGVENTNSSQPSFSLHWLTGTTHLELGETLSLISGLLANADFVSLPYGINRYKKMHVTLGGIKVLSEPGVPDTMPPVCVVVPGEGCEILGLSKLQRLAEILKPTRVDLAFDGAPFSPIKLYEEYEKGNVRTRVRGHDYVHPKSKKANHWNLKRNPSGETFYLGSPASNWYMCAYNERGFTRLELRLSGERAELAYDALIGNPEQLKLTGLGWLREFCDFVDAEAESNKSRAPLLTFWSEFLGDIERCRMKLAGRVAETIERTVRWIQDQVSASLVIYFKLGHSFQELLEIGEERFRNRHKALLAMAGCT